MIGAIASHIFILGIDTNNDGGKLFYLALTVFVFCVILLIKFKKESMNKDQSVYEILHEILTEQQNLLRKVSAKMYTQSIPSLDGSTIGGHTRHIIEFLEILRNSYHTNQINYDERQRNPELEQNPEKAIEIISKYFQH
jgi:hypothetical protein